MGSSKAAKYLKLAGSADAEKAIAEEEAAVWAALTEPVEMEFQRPHYWNWRAAAIGRNITRNLYDTLYLTPRSWSNERAAKLEAKRKELYSAASSLFGVERQVMLGYKLAGDELADLLSGVRYHASCFDNCLNLIIIQALFSQIPRSSPAVEIYREYLRYETPRLGIWASLFRHYAGALALIRISRILSKAFLGREETIALPKQVLQRFTQRWKLIQETYNTYPELFPNMRLPQMTELLPLRENEADIAKNLFTTAQQLDQPVDISAAACAFSIVQLDLVLLKKAKEEVR